jgi:hypothetical protein
MAHIEAMLRQARLYQREVQRIRDYLNSGDRDRASRLLADGKVVKQMEELRRQCDLLTKSIDGVEEFISEERQART